LFSLRTASTATNLDVGGVLPTVDGISASRRRVYEEALRQFGQRGFHAVSVRDIAEVLGVQPGALYAHAKSKQQLLFELVRIGYVTHWEWVREAVLEAGNDPGEQLEALVAAHVSVHLQYRDLARVVAREYRSLTPEQQESLDEIEDQSVELSAAIVARGVKRGVFSAEVDVTLALSAIASMGVRAAEWWEPETGPPADYVARNYARYAIKIFT
jgi:AcrR family transcriptional regulator